MSTINCIYDVRLDLKDLILNIVDLISIKKETSIKNPTFLLMGIASFVKTDFKKVDASFKKFGVNYLEMMKKYIQSTDLIFYFEFDFILGGFSQLVLNNMGFSQSKLFPDKDIQMIKSQLQVELLLSGKNFILLPNVLMKCSDISFNFK
jgi:hypothetical protein